MAASMHIGLVVYGGLDRTSGGYRYDRKLVSHLERRGDDVEVIAIPDDTDRASDDAGRTPDEVGRGSDETGRDRPTRSDPDSVRSRLNRPFDVLLQDELCHPSLWQHNPHLDRPELLVSLVHLLRTGDPAASFDPSIRRRERRYLETVDAAICTSRDTRDRTLELAMVPTVVAPPAGRIETAAFDPDAIRARANDGPLRVGFVGNLIPRKGVRTLLSGLARVDSEWELTVVGSHGADPEYAESTVEHADALGIDGRVEFAGRVESHALESILECVHVLAVPARYEGFGMVYLEAMEYGVVPVASAVGGADEFVRDGANGVLVDPGDPARLAAVLTRLANDRETLAELGVSALETAREHPTWEETMDDARSYLLERLDERTGASHR